MLDLSLSLLLAIMVLILAVWGALVGAKALPKYENKTFHVYGLLVVGALAMVLTVFVGVRGYYAQETAAIQQTQLTKSLSQTSQDLTKANETLAQSRLSEEYMKGQLNGLSMMVGKLDSDGSSGSKNLVKALNQIGAGADRPAIQKLTNKELKSRVIQFVDDMRTFAAQVITTRQAQMDQDLADYQNARAKDGAPNGPLQRQTFARTRLNEQNASSELTLEISKNIGFAKLYHDELERRLGQQKPLIGPDFGAALWETSPPYAEHNLYVTARVLDELARELPD